VFAERTSEYLAFQKVGLAVLGCVGLARLGLSLSGMPDSAVRWVSMNAVGWLAAFAYGVVARKSVRGYRGLLRFVFLQALLFHAIAVLGILLNLAGLPNIYGAPEYSGPASHNQWLHAAAHLTIGLVAATLLWWGAASLSLLVVRKLARSATSA